MDPKTEEIFVEALALDADRRAAFLNEACGDDSDLYDKVAEMLRDAALADSFFGGVSGLPGSDAFAGKEGDLIGSYTLRQKLGEGGFGEVWMAEQHKPISRMVALKVIKAGLDTREFLARFESERQALAMMDHPNIAKVLDAGATATGRPYFAMELVRGIPITRFCDEAGLVTEARLALFTDVCSAIGHAHQKGVIHRDIKPSNVLVTLHGDKPVAKVIDFGIAKAVEGKLTDFTLFTRFEQFLGTPAYMSPEQASLSGLDIDTRADIYGLGVLLYELLVGKPPFESHTLVEAGYDEMRRIIREVEPARPSAKLKTTSAEERVQIARARSLPPEKVSHLVEPDLDWIVLKAIEKDRARRYATADELARDVGRFLANEPVTATPPSAGYLFSKFAKRHRLALRVGGTIAMLLLLATLLSSWLAVRATEAEKLASEKLAEASAERDEKEAALKESELQKSKAIEAENLASDRLAQATIERDAKEQALQNAEAISNFLIEVFQSPNPYRDGRAVTVVEALDAAVKKLKTDLPDQPERQATLLEVLASTYQQLGLPHRARELQEEVLEIRRKSLGVEHSDTLGAIRKLATSCHTTGFFDREVALLEEEIRVRETLTGREGPDSLQMYFAQRHIGGAYFEIGRYPEALARRKRALEIYRKSRGPDDHNTLAEMASLMNFYHSLGEAYVGERRALAEEMLPLYQKAHGTDATETKQLQGQIDAMNSHYRSTQPKTDREEASAKRMASYEAHLRENEGNSDIPTLVTMLYLANAYAKVGRDEEACALAREALEISRVTYGTKSPHTLNMMAGLAGVESAVGRHDEATKLAEDTLALRREVFGPDHPENYDLMFRIRNCYFQMPGGFERGLAAGREAVNLIRRTYGVNHPKFIYEMGEFAGACGRAGRPEQALEIREELVSQIRQSGEISDRQSLKAMNTLADTYFYLDKDQKGFELLAECASLQRDDTFINLKAAAYAAWLNRTATYEEIRKRTVEWAVDHRDRIQDFDALERVLYLACLRPCETPGIRKNLTLLTDRLNQLCAESPLSRTRFDAISGAVLFRQDRFKEAAATLELTRKRANELTNEGARSFLLQYTELFQAQTLLREGYRSEARELFLTTESGMDSSQRDMRLGVRNTPSHLNSVIIGLALKEAAIAISGE